MFSTHKNISRSFLGFVLSSVIALQLSACATIPNSSSASSKSGCSSAASSSETEIMLTDERSNLSLWIPSDWDDIAIVETSTEFYEDTERYDSSYLLFYVYETLAHTKDDTTGRVWGIYSIQEDELQNIYGSEVDYSKTIGIETRVIGTDGDTVYLLMESSDVQFIEDPEYLEPTESQLQYERLQRESQMVIDKFLKNNQIKVNEECPQTPCYSPTPTK